MRASDYTHRLKAYLRTPKALLCIGHFLSSWGDRMWVFVVGLFLVKLNVTSLLLTAAYGLALAAVIIFAGPVAGDWVDMNGRIKVIKITLASQNLLVVASAVVYIILIQVPVSQAVNVTLQVILIATGALANLASAAHKIAITRDWLVVISMGSKSALADINAKMRRIDLVCAILAPIVVGQMIEFTSMLVGAIFICAWNIVSLVIEYYLFIKVYKKVPRLALKVASSEDLQSQRGSLENLSNQEVKNDVKSNHTTNKESKKPIYRIILLRMLSSFIAIKRGWATYVKQDVAIAGICLAILYLTVLGFNVVTTGYIYAQGVSEGFVSLARAGGAICGVLGTYLFQIIRPRLGLVKTGLISLGLQLSVLMLCLASVFAPGSFFYGGTSLDNSNTNCSNVSTVATSNQFGPTDCSHFGFPSTPTISIILFMIGLVTSRAGLWMYDLSSTQLFQEYVIESNRGIVGGVQDAFNNILDLIQFILVMIFPEIDTFWMLILLSVAVIAFSFSLYIVFIFRVKCGDALRELPQSDAEDEIRNNNRPHQDDSIDDERPAAMANNRPKSKETTV